jgi:hypothetical protein
MSTDWHRLQSEFSRQLQQGTGQGPDDVRHMSELLAQEYLSGEINRTETDWDAVEEACLALQRQNEAEADRLAAELESMLADEAPDEAPDDFDKMIAAYERGDLESANQLAEQFLADAMESDDEEED